MILTQCQNKIRYAFFVNTNKSNYIYLQTISLNIPMFQLFVNTFVFNIMYTLQTFEG